jgi:hypothetical protein
LWNEDRKEPVTKLIEWREYIIKIHMTTENRRNLGKADTSRTRTKGQSSLYKVLGIQCKEIIGQMIYTQTNSGGENQHLTNKAGKKPPLSRLTENGEK